MLEDTYIPLNRQFSLFSSSNNNSELDWEERWHRRYSSNDSIGWDELLEKDKVIILAEAGAGKTDEFKAMAQQLYSAGKPAFFCRIEYLLDSDFDFDDAGIGNDDDFNAWKKSCDHDCLGYFFLDSVDEAKLKDASAFRRALKQFAKKVGRDNYQRAKIFVSSRFSEWSAKTDLDHFASRFNLSEDNKKECVYTLDSLTASQILTFATAKKVTDPPAFIEAIERADAKLFASRPQDLLDLVTYWNDKKALGRHIEMLEYSIKKKLVERNETHHKQDSLSMDDIEQGVQYLAAAATFLKENKIRVANDGIINPREVLPDWNQQKLDLLLTLPIFDYPIYGAVRFHHRSVREFLTAKWLFRLLQEGSSRQQIEALLITRQYGQLVAIPSMQAIAVWLACWDNTIRQKLMYVAPKILIEFGDPSEFSLACRFELLDTLIKRYKDQQHSDLKIDPIMIKRFATEMTAEILKDRLETNANHHDLTYLLLNIILHGQVAGLAAEASQIALSNKFSKKFFSSIRDIAFQIVLVTGSTQQKKQLIKQLLVQDGGGRSIISRVSMSFFHEVLLMDELLEFIEYSQQGKRNREELIFVYRNKIINWLEKSDSERKPYVFKFLIRLYQKGELRQEELRQLRQLAESQPALFRFQTVLKPPVMIETKQEAVEDESICLIEKSEIERRKQQEKTRLKWSSYVKNNANKIKCFSVSDDKKLKEAVSALYGYLHNLDYDDVAFGIKNWELLIPDFGVNVAENFRDGCIACWRKYDLLDENISYSLYESRRSRKTALTGIAMEARFVPNWVEYLSREEVRQATNFAVLELSHLPYWLIDLQDAFPKEVKETLMMQLNNCLLKKFFRIKTMVSTESYFFYEKVDYQEALIEILEKNIDSEYQKLLRDIVWLILNKRLSSQLKNRLSLLVQSLLVRSNDIETRQIWLILLFHVDADKGVLNLKEWLNQQANNHLKKELVVGLFKYTEVEYVRHSVYMDIHKNNKDYKRLEILAYLVPLSFQYLPVHEENDRLAKFGKYTPPPYNGAYAERMRGRLLSLLEKTTGQKAYELLIKMANETSVLFYKDYLYWLALCRAEKDAEIAMEYIQWSEKNIPNFAKDVRKAIGRKAGFISHDQLRDDLIAIALIETNSRNAIAKESEDETNDRFRNALLHKGYCVADQSRGGESQSGINAGERDLVIRNTEGVDESIIEAFVLKSLDTQTIDGHYEKLTQRYDTVGCATNFILVYVKTKAFDRLWKKYQTYKTFRNFTDTKNKYSEKRNIRIGTSDVNGMVIYHLFINFYSHGKSTT